MKRFQVLLVTLLFTAFSTPIMASSVFHKIDGCILMYTSNSGWTQGTVSGSAYLNIRHMDGLIMTASSFKFEFGGNRTTVRATKSEKRKTVAAFLRCTED